MNSEKTESDANTAGISTTSGRVLEASSKGGTLDDLLAALRVGNWVESVVVNLGPRDVSGNRYGVWSANRASATVEGDIEADVIEIDQRLDGLKDAASIYIDSVRATVETVDTVCEDVELSLRKLRAQRANSLNIKAGT